MHFLETFDEKDGKPKYFMQILEKCHPIVYNYFYQEFGNFADTFFRKVGYFYGYAGGSKIRKTFQTIKFNNRRSHIIV